SGRNTSQLRARPTVTRSFQRWKRWRVPSALSMVISAMGRPRFYTGRKRRSVRGGGGLRTLALHREVALAHAQLGVLARDADLDGAPGAVRRALGRVAEQVVVVQLVGDPGEDPHQLPDLLGEEVLPARLAGDLAQEPARPAIEQPGSAADAHAVDGGLHRARVVDHVLLAERARGVVAVREHDQGLAPRLVADAVQRVVDRVVEAGAAPGLQVLHELLEALDVVGE